MKTCSNCKQSLPFDDFHYKKSSKDGRRENCKSCRKMESHKRYAHSSVVAARDLISIPTLKAHARMSRAGIKRVGIRKCTWCREFGHNRRNCPHDPPLVPAMQRKNQAAQERISRLEGEERQRFRAYNRTRVYGLKPEDLTAMRAAQRNACGVCGKKMTSGSGWQHEHIDHDHETGVVRGLLCGPCNTTVGQIEKLLKQGLLDRALNWVRQDRSAAPLQRGASW
jgi:hypothetical protein